uniref:Dimer_Tnp_hAT domain-containing protein n=1 Tax=Caenorhabditis japonica TaxID=281687 RepID=A0A8R1DRA9_CAEJA
MFSCCHCGEITDRKNLVALPTDESTLNAWIQMFELQLDYKTDENDKYYVCESHVEGLEEIHDDEVNMESVSEKMASDDVDPFALDVKQEIEEMEEENPEYMWREPKQEPMNIDYDELPREVDFEAESLQSSSLQLAKYEEEEPTTSSSFSHEVNDDDDQRYSGVPFYFPELSDENIFSLCVKSTGMISGVSRMECGYCPEEHSFDVNTRSIRHHLHLKHPKIMRFISLHGYAPRAPKSFAPLEAKRKEAADVLMLKFLLRNGQPLSTVNDRNLSGLVFNMNSGYHLPTEQALFEIATKIGNSRSINQQDDSNPVTVTFDTTRLHNVNYVVFTISYFDVNNEPKKCLFLKDFEPALKTVPSIINAIKVAAGEPDSPLSITTIVTGKAEFEEALEDIGSFKQVTVCFSVNISKFAHELLRLPCFAAPLATLRNFINELPKNRSIWNEFKQFIVKKRTYGEFPFIEDGPWYTTIDFITRCLHMVWGFFCLEKKIRDDGDKHLPNGFSSGFSSLKNSAVIDNEVVDFSSFVSHARREVIGCMEWWSRYAHRFPRLYKLARELFQIPAFSVDANFYLGDYGLLTYSLQNLDDQKRRIMLQASGEVLDIRQKGDIMVKTICVKRKRDPQFPEDAWYNSVRRAPTLPAESSAPHLEMQQKRLNFPKKVPMPRLQSYAPAGSNDPIMKIDRVPKSRPSNFRRRDPSLITEMPRTLKQEMERMGVAYPQRSTIVAQRKYTVAPQRQGEPTQVVKLEPVEDGSGVVKTEPLESVVKTEENGAMSAKKYYAVRQGHPNSQRLIPVINPASRFLPGTSTVRHPMIVRTVSIVNGNSTAQKTYFVRKRTGPPLPCQPRSSK